MARNEDSAKAANTAPAKQLSNGIGFIPLRPAIVQIEKKQDGHVGNKVGQLPPPGVTICLQRGSLRPPHNTAHSSGASGAVLGQPQLSAVLLGEI